jgi:hypothetical protein
MKSYKKKSKFYFDRLKHLKESKITLNLINDLDLMTNEFNESVKHLHLFSDYDELHLAKLDLLYAN